MRTTKKISATAAASAALAIAALALPGGAHAQSTVAVELGDGTIMANGAAASIPLTITCSPGTRNALVALTVSQNVNGTIALGSGYATISECSGEPQESVMHAAAVNTAFVESVAWGRVLFQDTEFGANPPVFTEKEIKLSF